MSSKLKGALGLTASIIIVASLAFGATMKLAKPAGGNQDSAQNQSEMSSTSQQPTTYEVPLNADNQEPINAQVKPNDFVQFNSDDGGKHEIIQIDKGEHAGEELKSGVFGADEGYRVQFKDLGTFYLKDTFNPEQNITVVVQE